MEYQILNGDALAHEFPSAKIPGAIIIMREALIAGDVSGNTLDEFWQARANYLQVTLEEYHQSAVKEFETIMEAPEHTVFNCWFEYDLFCQVNMWFMLSIIHHLSIHKKVYAVYTTHLNKNSPHFWNGFGPATQADLVTCFNTRELLNESDLQLGNDLWKAYKNGQLKQLKHLAENAPASFPYLKEAIQAHIDRFPEDGSTGRPEKVLRDITKNISTDFSTVFREFWKRESIYGFGDTQLKEIYDKVMEQH